MDDWGYGDDEPIACCPSCGIPYRDHMGLNGTCERLIKSKLLLDESIRLGMLILSVTLPMELTNKNKGQGHSWHHTADDRKDCDPCLKALGHIRKPFKAKMGVNTAWDFGLSWCPWS